MADPAFALLRGERGVADPRILTSNAVAAEWQIPAFSLGDEWRGSLERGGDSVLEQNVSTQIVLGIFAAILHTRRGKHKT